MKPKDKERLVKCRPMLLKGLDVDMLLPILVKEKIFSSKEEKEISQDARRRQRIIMLLDKMEKKKTENYHAFLDILADLDPHLYLMLTDEDFEGNPSDMHESLRDDLTMLERVRDYLVSEIDGAKVVPCIKRADLLTEPEKRTIMREQERSKRTEALLDILETKSPDAYDVLVEAISDTYPHIYLALTGQDDLDDGDSDDDW